MTAPVTVGTMIRQLAGMVDTKDLSKWESTFVSDMVDRSARGSQTAHLSSSQVEKIEQIWKKHFAG